MIDTPNRQKERFPDSLESRVRAKIKTILENKIKPDISYSGAACGADIIFIEEMLRLKKEVNIILPFAEDDYIRESVGIVGGS
jgi:adenylate cyclase